MGNLKIKRGMVPVADGKGGWFLLDEAGPGRVTSALASELIGLILQGISGEDDLASALESRFSPEEVFFTLIHLERQGVIVKDSGQRETPADVFRAGVLSRGFSASPGRRTSTLAVKIFATGGADSLADDLAGLLSRSDMLNIERIPDGYQKELSPDDLYVAVTSDILDPELEAFGRLALQRGLRWLSVKPSGIVPQIGPLFLPEQTGCAVCLLDRVKGHRRREWEAILAAKDRKPLLLSVGMTPFSLEAVTGVLAVELEKLAAGDVSDLVGCALTLNFRELRLDRHLLTRRPQCPECGTLAKGGAHFGSLPEEPLRLQSRIKADHRDGGERVCSAVETLETYASLISPVTGVVKQLTSLDKCPACFGHIVRSDWIVRNAGKPARSEGNSRLTATGFSTGKGRTVPQARASALGEAVERYCSQYEGYEPSVRATFSELGDAAISPSDLMGFSQRQYRDREAWRQKGSTAYVADPYDEGRSIDWTPAWSLTQKRWRLIPSAFAYYFYPAEGGGDICWGCSNGVAAGNCLEEAIMQGFFELVERDATAMWWYHRLRKPSVDLNRIGSPFAASVNAAMGEMGMRLEVLDLTHDLGIPVFSATLFEPEDGGRLHSLGLGCHRDPRIALERALGELGQCWGLADIDDYSLRFQGTPLSREPFLKPDPDKPPKTLSDFSRGQSVDFLDDIEDSVGLLKDLGLEMLVMDLTRPDVGFPVVRVIIPGLMHFWPRFGFRRLFEVPRALGWIGENAGEDDLNSVPFFL